jgi:hypothetical protein
MDIAKIFAVMALCHVWTARPWQGFSLTVMRGWLVQPCVRPVDAALDGRWP